MYKIISILLSIFLYTSVFAQKPVLTQQLGHTHLATCTATDPAGKLAASGSLDNTVKVWDLLSGKLLYTLKGHTNAVTECVFSSDGKTVFSASLDKTIKMWNVQTGEIIRTFRGHSSGVSSLALSRNNKVVAGGSWDGYVRLWSIQSATELVSYRKHNDIVNSIDFSYDDKLIASASSDEKIILWNISESRVSQYYKKHNAEVTNIKFLFGSKLFASLGKDNKIRIFDYTTQRETTVIGSGEELNSLSVSSGGKIVYSISGNTIKGWNVDDGKIVHLAKTKFQNLSALSLDRLTTYFLAVHHKTMVLLDYTSGKELQPYEGYSPVVATVDISPDTKIIASGNRDNTIRLWHKETGRDLTILAGHSDYVEFVQFSPDNKLLASASHDKTIRIWEVSPKGNSKALSTFTGHTAEVTSLDFRIDGKYIASGSSDKTVRLWKVATGENVRTFEGHKERVHSVSLSSDGKYIASGSWDATIKIWDVNDNKLIHTLKGHEGDVWSVDFNSAGKLLASGGADGTIRLWDVEKGKLIKTLTGHSDHVKSVSFSPDGKQIASGSWDNTIKIWDVFTGELIKTLSGHSNYVRSIVFSPDGKFLVSGSSDSQMKIWNVTSGKEILSVIAFSNGKDFVVTTPDGYFDGTSAGIEKALHYVAGTEIIPLESFFEKFYMPNLWARVVAGEKFDENEVDIQDKIKLPPKIKIVSPIDNFISNTTFMQITVEATDMGGGIDEIRLYHNNKLIDNSKRAFKPIEKKGEKRIKTFTVTLMSGINVFKATAFNNDRTESRTHIITVEYNGIVPQSRLFLFTIGIDTYKNATYNLNYAKADADGIAEAFEKRGNRIFSEIIRYDIRNEEATKSNIESTFSQIRVKAKQSDVFVFFYAGHGVMSDGEADKSDFYLVPHDITQIYGNDEILNTKGIASEHLMELSKKVKAQKQLIILDACQSGGAIELMASRGVAEQKALMQLARSAGVAVIASSGTKQFATEFKELEHGVFTYAFLEGLSGKADGGSRDKKITINELRAFLDDRVPELTKQYRGEAQYPTSYSRGQDFPVGIYGY